MPHDQTRAMPPSKSRRYWLIAVIFLCLVAGIWVCVFQFWGDENEHDLSDSQLQAYGWFTLPPGATNVKSHLVSGQGYFLATTFTMPADQMKSFLQSTHCHNADPTTRPASHLFLQGSDAPWWTPGNPDRSFKVVGINSEGQQAILIDQTNPDVYTAWITVTMD